MCPIHFKACQGLACHGVGGVNRSMNAVEL